MANIRDEQTSLRAKLRNGTLRPEDMGNATRRTLWPELWQRANMQTGHRAVITGQEETSVTDTLIKCHNCKNNTVQTRELQTRSSDEPMTVFCNCTTCGKRWKM